MGYNDRRNSVCHGDKSDERVLFHRTGSISSDKSRSIGFLIINATNDTVAGTLLLQSAANNAKCI